MGFHYLDDQAVERIGLGLLDRTLPKADWTHAAHFAATLWILRARPDIDIDGRLPDVIRGYNAATGVENSDSSGYHETITRASLRAGRAFLAGRPASQPLHEIIDLLMASPLGRSDGLLRHWRRETLFSVAARRGFVPPDLEPMTAGPPGAP